MTEQRPTLAVIAAEAGVSLATVSKVVNGRSDVARGTRDRVEAILRAHNYLTPGRPARSRRSGLVDLVLSGLDSSWAVEILRGAEAECAEHGVGMVVSILRSDEAVPPSWTDLPALHHSDGVILVTSEATEGQIRKVRAAGVELVVIDPVALPEGVPSVGATNWAGGLAATEHLLSLGHRRIAVIGGRKELICSQARIDGYRAAMERADVPVDRSLIRFGDFQHEGGFRNAAELLALPDPPTAIFAGSDVQAMGAYEAARQAGLRVPEDVSIVGFDDLPLCDWLSPPLTTVRQPLEEMGRTAARMLLQLLDGVRPVSHRVELATELKVRHSTTAPPTP